MSSLRYVLNRNDLALVNRNIPIKTYSKKRT